MESLNTNCDNKQRLAIRAELATVSFEDLQKMKKEITSKLYNEAVFKNSSKHQKKLKTDFKRKNKNRPREMSAKKYISLSDNAVPSSSFQSRDPRFDPLCGSFDKKKFNSHYKFLSKIKVKECQQLKSELKETTDPQRAKKIKYLIQRIENQIREENRIKIENIKNYEETTENIKKMKEGQNPVYKSKTEKRILNIVSKYEELKESGKLKKHVERQRKKVRAKDRKKLENCL